MSLRSVNLNLLPVLHALLRERNVSRAATALGMTQPAASAALAKLRLMLNDPLLVRVGRRLELSPRAARLLEQVEEACGLLEGVWADTKFEPALSTRSFVVAARDYMQVVLAPVLIETLARVASGVSVQFVEPSDDQFVRGGTLSIDVAVANRPALDARASLDLVIEPLFDDRIVMVIGPRHRLYAQPVLESGDFGEDRFLVLNARGQATESGLAEFITRYERVGSNVFESRNINSLLLMVMQTDHVALVPLRLVATVTGFMPLRVVGDAFGGERFDVCMAWNRWLELDPAHRWFRDILRTAGRHASELGHHTRRPANKSDRQP